MIAGITDSNSLLLKISTLHQMLLEKSTLWMHELTTMKSPKHPVNSRISNTGYVQMHSVKCRNQRRENTEFLHHHPECLQSNSFGGRGGHGRATHVSMDSKRCIIATLTPLTKALCSITHIIHKALWSSSQLWEVDLWCTDTSKWATYRIRCFSFYVSKFVSLPCLWHILAVSMSYLGIIEVDASKSGWVLLNDTTPANRGPKEKANMRFFPE